MDCHSKTGNQTSLDCMHIFSLATAWHFLLSYLLILTEEFFTPFFKTSNIDRGAKTTAYPHSRRPFEKEHVSSLNFFESLTSIYWSVIELFTINKKDPSEFAK